MNGVKRKNGYTVCGCVGPGRERERVTERKGGKEKEGEGCVSGRGGGRLARGVSLFAFMETDLRWFGVFICGLGLTWQADVIKMLLNVFFKY